MYACALSGKFGNLMLLDCRTLYYGHNRMYHFVTKTPTDYNVNDAFEFASYEIIPDVQLDHRFMFNVEFWNEIDKPLHICHYRDNVLATITLDTINVLYPEMRVGLSLNALCMLCDMYYN